MLSNESIKAAIRKSINEATGVDTSLIKGNVSFDSYGIDSVVAVQLTGDLGDLVGFDLSPTLLYEYSTVDKLAEHVASLVESTRVVS